MRVAAAAMTFRLQPTRFLPSDSSLRFSQAGRRSFVYGRNYMWRLTPKACKKKEKKRKKNSSPVIAK